jgi:hypothetical protein
VSRRALRGPSWVHVFGDVYVAEGVALDDAGRLEALRLAMPPDAVAIGMTAAWMYGVWSPPPDSAVPLVVAVPKGRKLTMRGVQVRRLTFDEIDLNQMHDVAITSPLRTCFDLVRTLPREGQAYWPYYWDQVPVIEATVWVDGFLRLEAFTRKRFLDYADERRFWPGVERGRDAAGYARNGTDSGFETRLRLIYVLGRMPAPDVNVPVFDEDGNIEARPDLKLKTQPWITHSVYSEFDGVRFHGSEDQRTYDDLRENRLVLRSAIVLRYTARPLLSQPNRVLAEASKATGFPYVPLG